LPAATGCGRDAAPAAPGTSAAAEPTLEQKIKGVEADPTIPADAKANVIAGLRAEDAARKQQEAQGRPNPAAPPKP
jgi:hypothetical protein